MIQTPTTRLSYTGGVEQHDSDSFVTSGILRLLSTKRAISRQASADMTPRNGRDQIIFSEFSDNFQLTERGTLYHGCDYDAWLRRVQIALRRRRTVRLTGTHTSDERNLSAIPATNDLGTILAMINKQVLLRVPDEHKSSVNALLRVLPIYSLPFRFMDLPLELRLRVYRETDRPRIVQVSSYDLSWWEEHVNKQAVAPPLARVSPTIRQELRPEIYKELRIGCTGYIKWCFDYFTKEDLRYLTRASVNLDYLHSIGHDWDRVSEEISLHFELSPRRSLCYWLEYDNEILTWSEIEPTGKFKRNLHTAIRQRGLNVPAPDLRGLGLVALVEEVHDLYEPSWLIDCRFDWVPGRGVGEKIYFPRDESLDGVVDMKSDTDLVLS